MIGFNDAPPQPTPPRFALGRLLITTGASEACQAAGVEPGDLIARHARGDYGDLDAHDQAVNERAIRERYQILSRYWLPSGVPLYVITDPDRTQTLVMRAEEY